MGALSRVGGNWAGSTHPEYIAFVSRWPSSWAAEFADLLTLLNKQDSKFNINFHMSLIINEMFQFEIMSSSNRIHN